MRFFSFPVCTVHDLCDILFHYLQLYLILWFYYLHFPLCHDIFYCIYLHLFYFLSVYLSQEPRMTIKRFWFWFCNEQHWKSHVLTNANTNFFFSCFLLYGQLTDPKWISWDSTAASCIFNAPAACCWAVMELMTEDEKKTPLDFTGTWSLFVCIIWNVTSQ